LATSLPPLESYNTGVSGFRTATAAADALWTTAAAAAAIAEAEAAAEEAASAASLNDWWPGLEVGGLEATPRICRRDDNLCEISHGAELQALRPFGGDASRKDTGASLEEA
jgi:hypothetical protein